MKCLYSLVCVAVAVFAFGGCQEAQSKSSTASKTTPKVDSEVVPAAATSDAKNEKEDKSIKIGDQGPAWENLAGTDDKKHSLKDLKESKAVAVIFTCNTCPVAVAYEDRMMKLSSDYKDKGVSLVAINVNKDPRNDLEAMKKRAEEKGFAFEYLFDPSQQIARDYGATVTPHVFLLDGKGKVAYMGAIDDEMNVDAVKQHYLKDAIDAVLAGKEPAVATTKQVGCGIKYE
jgi:peroxiredoxin